MFLLFTGNLGSAGEAKNILINKQVSLGKTPETLDLLLKEHISKNESINETAPPPNPPSTPPAIEGDLNNDGVVDKKDVDELEKALLLGDLNGDGKLDYKDYAKLSQMITAPIPPGQTIPDLNGDNKLDINDLNMLGDILDKADLDKNGSVNGVDLQSLKDIVDSIPTAGNSSPFGLDSFNTTYDFVIKPELQNNSVDLDKLLTSLDDVGKDLPDPATLNPSKVTIGYEKKVIKFAQALFDVGIAIRSGSPWTEDQATHLSAAIKKLDKHIEKIKKKYNPSYTLAPGNHALLFWYGITIPTNSADFNGNGKLDADDLLKCY